MCDSNTANCLPKVITSLDSVVVKSPSDPLFVLDCYHEY